MAGRPTDESAFLRAIREEPTEETNWLVYADWLDERGDPRAEVLRIFGVIGLIQNLEFYPELKARLEALRPSIDPQWLDQIARLRELQFRP
ncbi:MAG TPA: TIGR02996 domain-containing protein, partial [Gemmataceae bacterium]|nr:TIGR02996 domain-containing protein [Gemmataceae bacterium]